MSEALTPPEKSARKRAFSVYFAFGNRDIALQGQTATPWIIGCAGVGRIFSYRAQVFHNSQPRINCILRRKRLYWKSLTSKWGYAFNLKKRRSAFLYSVAASTRYELWRLKPGAFLTLISRCCALPGFLDLYYRYKTKKRRGACVISYEAKVRNNRGFICFGHNRSTDRWSPCENALLSDAY